MNLNVNVERTFNIFELRSEDEWWLNSWDSFLEAISTELPEFDGKIPWILFIKSSFKIIRAFDNGAKRDLVISSFKDSDTILGYHPDEFVKNSGFGEEHFNARVIVSPDGKIPTVASLRTSYNISHCGVKCDKCEKRNCFAKQSENQDKPAIYVGGNLRILKSDDFQPLDSNNQSRDHSFIINKQGKLIYGAPGYEVTNEGFPKNLFDFFNKPIEPVDIRISICGDNGRERE